MGLVLFDEVLLGKSAKVMLDLGSESSLIHISLLEGWNVAYRVSGLKAQRVDHKGEVTIRC